jgi:hypothetical protein
MSDWICLDHFISPQGAAERDHGYLLRVPPGEAKFLPAEEALRWREDQLAKVG